METDATLVEQTLSGNNSAFNHLVEKYQGEIFAISLSVAKNPEDAKDISQETFLQAYVNLQQLRNPDRFPEWLKKIAWNQSKKWCRQHDKMESVPLESVAQEEYKETSADEKLVQTEFVDTSEEIEEEDPATLTAGVEEPKVESPEEGASKDIIPGSIGGRVEIRPPLTIAPIAGATVSYIGPKTGSVTTDIDGNFKISNLPPGKYTLNVRKAGYEDILEVPVTVWSGGDQRVDFRMEIASNTPALQLTE